MSFWNKIFTFTRKREIVPPCIQEARIEIDAAIKTEKVKANTEIKPWLSVSPLIRYELKSYQFSSRSKNMLSQCHPDIQLVLNEAIKYIDFAVIEGWRVKATQDKYFAKGASKVKWPNSYHNTIVEHIKPEYRPENMNSATACSLAVDIIPSPLKSWDDYEAFAKLTAVIKAVAADMKIPLQNGYELWGWDYPHFQLTVYRRKKQ